MKKFIQKNAFLSCIIMNNKRMKKKFLFTVSLVILNFFFTESLTFSQTTWEITSEEKFNKVTIFSDSKIERTIPVLSSDENIIPGHFVTNPLNKGNALSDWMPLQTVNGVVIDISFATPTVGYMAAELGIVYKTTDAGSNWTTVMNLDFPYYWYGVHAFSTEKVLIAGFNNSTGDGIMRWTTDGGVNWSDDIIVAPAPFNWLMDLDFADSLHGLAVGYLLSAGQVFITTNGGATAGDWTPYIADPTQGWFEGNFDLNPDGKYYITGISYCTSTDYGLTWSSRNSIDNVFDGGVSFLDDLHGWTGGGSIAPTVEGWVHRTTDGGNNWSDRVLTASYPIRVVHFYDELNGFAQGGDGNSGLGGVYESTDGGINWTEVLTTNLEMNTFDWERISPDTIDIWTVGFSSAGGWHSVVYKKRVAETVVPVELVSFVADVNKNNVTLNWATASETNNQGFDVERKSLNEWEKIGFVAGNGTVTETKIYQFIDEKISAGKYIYRLKQTDFDGSFEYSNEVEVEVNQPAAFNLEQNFPNPFNPNTTLKFEIPEDEFVTVKIYDMLGQEVATLFSDNAKAGKYILNWNGLDYNGNQVSSGNYFYRMTAGEFEQSKKMMFLK